MLFSIAVAMAFSYPTVLLSGDPTAGVGAQPHHVWTSAKSMNTTHTDADLEMRQVWIYGSHMKALQKDVLQKGLQIQQSLFSEPEREIPIPNLSEQAIEDNHQWGFHSPLMYWNNSAQRLTADQDILNTINEHKHHSSSSLNVILRHASVFAGKRFSRRKLLAADALVITLINKVGERVGSRWQDKMSSLTQNVCPDCTLFPRNGDASNHQIYEFSFMPLSLRENTILAIAYTCMAIYVLLSLRRIKAFHSRFGLVVTAITQMTFSISASFTICGILHINLAMIPRNAYPFIVLVIGLENMFRLINAVLAYPPTMATDLRIANALGDIGPLSVVTAAQNLFILSILSAVLSPGIAAFCAFAALATLFDVFFLLTFFVAVLNVDIRRFELQDSLSARQHSSERPSRTARRASPSQHTWFDALMSGRLPFSTRMAGTAVTTTFILSLNYHFFEREEMSLSLRHLLGFAPAGIPIDTDLDTFTRLPINASITPSEWMRMQDFDAAKGVMKLANAGNHTFIMKIFAPTVIVLAGADRTGSLDEREAWSLAVRAFTIHHFYPVAIAVIFGVAFVSVLMNFLLYSEPDDGAIETDDDSDQHISVVSIGLPHKLDIVRLNGNENGHFVSVALDRTIAISTLDHSTGLYSTANVPTGILGDLSWPIRDLSIDDSGKWIAGHCAGGKVFLYNHVTGSEDLHFAPYPDQSPALVFDFTYLPGNLEKRACFMTLTAAGRLTMSSLDDHILTGVDVSVVPLVGAAIADFTLRGREMIVINEDASVLSFVWNKASWVCQAQKQIDMPRVTSEIVAIEVYMHREKEIVSLSTLAGIALLDATTFDVITKVDYFVAQPGYDRVMMGPPRKCAVCGGLAVQSLTRLSIGEDGREGSINKWEITDVADDEANICLERNAINCKSFKDTRSRVKEFRAAGAWAVLNDQVLLGLRRKETIRKGAEVVRDRRQARQQLRSLAAPEQWEAYKISVDNGLECIDIGVSTGSSFISQSALYVESAGPAITLGEQAVAVAFGNVVQIVHATRRTTVGRRSRLPSLDRNASMTRKTASLRKQK
ncbi:uncharacterized protein K489DRAFT_376978 [Dissoconium aciculare CBS 342.82]|uniref:SSD domain-containing protein n=1 Tax=Dissoconium aciculare CBS 342.82 TaxID=1314786 RepID=A0A6J3MFW5_9PEZI|nr:uncharacterized protein K489DRAFT_376978 [Dissoconium aciculare CBS 342.82]KAF1826554.1 hypothetical protein K489DRAFT_376978 [Dissoconium aciculare CBS 342.82]